VRSSWVLFFTLFFLDIELVLLAIGYMLSNSSILIAANSFGFIVAFCSCTFVHSLSRTDHLSCLMATDSFYIRLGWMLWTLQRRAHSFHAACLCYV
jgi:hypothetical protein